MIQEFSMLLCDEGLRCQDDFHKRKREIGWCKNLSRADECSSLVKLSIFMSVVLLDASVEVKKGGYIQVNLIVSLNTFLSVAPLLSPSGTLSPFRISIVSVLATFHGLSQKWWNHRVRPSFFTCRRDSCACYK